MSDGIRRLPGARWRTDPREATIRQSLILAVLPLAVAETLVWAAFYYSFPALMPVWEADLGWSRGEITGAFTGALVVSGLLAPFAGRLVDREWSTALFLGAIAVGGGLLVALAHVQTLAQFWAVWLGLGLVNACCLYETCFAIITVTVGAAARRAITVVTLVAGFAGTVSFPSAAILSELWGWRTAVLVFAGVVWVVALPVAAFGLHLLRAHRAPAARPEATAGAARAARANPAFGGLAVMFAVIGLVHGMIIGHVLPLLADRGLSGALAVTVAASIGPMQVLGRVVIVALGPRIGTYGAGLGCFAGMALGLAALMGAGVAPWLAMAFVVPYGAAYGVISIVRPVITAEILGRAGFGAVAGMLAVPYVLGFAAGPRLGTAFWHGGGYDLVLAVCLALLVIGAAGLVFARRIAGRA